MKNSEVPKILEGMSELEMAFYAKYKLPNLSRAFKYELRKQLNEKGLTSAKIDKLTREVAFSRENSADSCSRCGSHKVYHHKASAEKTKTHCLICGYVEGSNKTKSPFWSIFGI